MVAEKPAGGGWTRRTPVPDIAALLAHTLGHEKSTEVVDSALSALGYRGPLLERHEAEAVLEHLSKIPGIVGIAARFAQRRGFRAEDVDPPSGLRPREPTTVRAEIVALFMPSLGIEKAEDVVAAAQKKLGFTAALDARQGSALLEELASSPGAIGATARFAKARFLLRK